MVEGASQRKASNPPKILLSLAVEKMFAAQRDYYAALRKGFSGEPERTLHNESEHVAMRLVPVNENGQRLHACGHPMYDYRSDSLSSLAGLDPCSTCSTLFVYDELTKKTFAVNRYRIIGTMNVDHFLGFAQDSSFQKYPNGARFGSTMQIGGQLYGEVSTYFPTYTFAKLGYGTSERIAKVQRFYNLLLAHTNRLIRQAWPEDFT